MRRLPFLAALCSLLSASPALQAQLGSLDPTFNSTGYVVQPVNELDAAHKILVQADQKILVIGMSWDATYTARAYAFRYMPDGTPDTDFGNNGVFMHELDNEALLYSATITSTGKIVLVGATTDYQTYRMLLIQLNADGTLDDAFGTNGVVTQSVSLVGPNAEDMAYDVTVDPQNNNILVCGSSYDTNYVRRPVVVRFTPTGVLDTDFGVDGVATIPVMQVGSSAFKGIMVQPDGKIIATGYFGQSELWYLLLLVRFNADGTLDDTFSDDGIIKHNYGNVDDEGEDLKLTADGSIIVAGKTVTVTYNYSALLMKFTSTGEVDASFGNAGAVVEDLGDFDYGWNVELVDGKIIMAGSSGDGPPNGFDLAVWKYMPDGTPDAAFGNNGLAMHVIPDYYTMIYALDMQADGKILIGGQARTVNNDNFFFTARLENETPNQIAEVSGWIGVMLYPDPATAGSSVILRTTEPIQASAQIGLYASDGRRVCTYKSHQLDRQVGSISLQLPADIAPGAYQLTIQQQGAQLTSTILITN